MMMKLENLSMKPWRLAMVGLGLALASPLSWAAAAIQAITSTQQAGAEVVRVELSEPLQRRRDERLHLRPVDYIALGEDATIAWGAKDLKLRNDTGQRLRLRVQIVGAALSAHFEGVEPLADAFELAREERDVPGDDASGASGHEVVLLRVRRAASGEESRELVHRDVIPPRQVRSE